MALDARANANELLSGLNADEVEAVSVACSGPIDAREQTLFHETDPAERLYLVLDGAIHLHKRLPAHNGRPERDTPVATCRAGELVGWSALVPPHVYTLTGVVRQPSSCIEVNGPSLRRVLDAQPSLKAKVMATAAEIIAKRLQLMTEALIHERLLVIQEARRSHTAR